MQWVLRAQCSDREALEALLRSVQPSLQRYLSAVAGATDADDVLQDALVIIVRRLSGLHDPALFRPWAFRIASRLAFRHVKQRRLWQVRHTDDSQLEALPIPDVRPPDAAMRRLLAADTIPPASRAVLLLHFDEEMTLPEVAAVLEIPLGTAKSRLAYGLKAIRQILKQSGGACD